MNTAVNPLDGYKARLSGMAIEELDALYDAIVLARDTLMGVVNQPRYEKDMPSRRRNEAGKEVELFIDALNVYGDEVHDAAVSTVPKSGREVDQRAWLLLRHAVRCEDGLGDIAVQAAELAALHWRTKA
jgi:hypothetical protein